MKISNLSFGSQAGRARITATVTWENCARPPQELYFEVPEQYAAALTRSAHPFLVGCIVPALHYGEQRVAIDGDICPELLHGLTAAMRWLYRWYYPQARAAMTIEAPRRPATSTPTFPPRAGVFFSGGVDSFATLYHNRRSFPADHPRSIKDGVLVYGLELDSPAAFDLVLESLSQAAERVGVTLLPLYTNVYLPYRAEDETQGFSFWNNEFMGAALAAAAHALAGRLTTMAISAADNAHLRPHASHPVLEPNYSSAEMCIRYEGAELSRLEKVRHIVEWDEAMEQLRVCNFFKQYRPGAFNCGQCEKCVRTMLELVACGRADRLALFADNSMRGRKIASGFDINDVLVDTYTDLIAQGRPELATIVRRRLLVKRWRDVLHRLDRNWLAGSLHASARAIQATMVKCRSSIVSQEAAADSSTIDSHR